jgi:hypothetical protein
MGISGISEGTQPKVNYRTPAACVRRQVVTEMAPSPLRFAIGVGDPCMVAHISSRSRPDETCAGIKVFERLLVCQPGVHLQLHGIHHSQTC